MKNAYEVRGDITAIIINSPKYGRLEALISTCNLEVVQEFPNTWCVNRIKALNTFYVYGHTPRLNGKQGSVCLHRLVTNAQVGTDVDHKNHDGLNNTDDNLRVCTTAENGQNRQGAQCNSKSGIRGVCWVEQSKKWRARFRVKGKVVFLGFYTDLSEAEQEITKARSKYMPYSIESA